MGQKVNPHGLRVGVIKNWDSRWYASDEKFGDILVSDYNLRLPVRGNHRRRAAHLERLRRTVRGAARDEPQGDSAGIAFLLRL